jgi:hypothetical protein
LEEDVLLAVIAVHLIHRGGKCREDLHNNLSAPSPSPIKLPSPEVMKQVESPQHHSGFFACHGASNCSAHKREVSQCADSAMLIELFREIQEENWAIVAFLISRVVDSLSTRLLVTLRRMCFVD